VGGSENGQKMLSSFLDSPSMLLHYWESAPNPTEDRNYSKKFACGRQFSTPSSKLNGFDHVATLLGKCSKSDRRSQIFKKIRLRRAVQYTYLKIKWV
jgi:hypothetical protein